METQRLNLKLVTNEDAAFLYRLMNTDRWHQFIGDAGISSVEAAAQYIDQKMDADLCKKGFVNHLMIEKTTGQPVGTCSLHHRPGINGIDIGYALLPEFEGKGYATEGAKTMIALTFKVYEQSLVNAIANEHNRASCHLLEKLGFVSQGFIRLRSNNNKVKLYVLEKEHWRKNLMGEG